MASRSSKNAKSGGSEDAPTHSLDASTVKQQEANADAALETIKARFNFGFSAGKEIYASYKTAAPLLAQQARVPKVEINEMGPWGRGGPYVDFIYGEEVMPKWRDMFAPGDWATFYDIYNSPDRDDILRQMRAIEDEFLHKSLEQYTIMHNFRNIWNAQLAENKRKFEEQRALEARSSAHGFNAGSSSSSGLCPKWGLRCTYGNACMHRPRSPCPKHGDNCHFGNKCKFREGNAGRPPSNTGQRFANHDDRGRSSSASGLRRT